MPQESRVKKSLLNARVNLIFYFLTLLLSFFSRKIFLDCLGADFVGLTSTLQNLLGFLNLAELGISTAIGYILYKPIFDQNKVKINNIITVFGYIYRYIGFIILGIGIIIGCFLPLIFPKTSFDMGIIYFAYISFLTSSLIGYFANYKQVLLGADQKNYIITIYFQTTTIIKTILQMVATYYTGSYYLWILIEICFGFIYSAILNYKIKKIYPWLKNNLRQGFKLIKDYPELTKYTKQLFIQKISFFAQLQTIPFLTYAFVSLKTVAYYGNYTIITDKLSSLISNLLGSTSAGIGNLISEGNPNKIKNVFWELTSIRFFVASTISASTFFLISPFINLWLGPEYILSDTILILIVLRFFFSTMRGITDQFIFGYGLFYDTWAALTETVIYFVGVIIGGHFWGLEGILMGSIISLFSIAGIWKPYFLFSKGFKESVWDYWKYWISNLLLCITSFIITFFIERSLFTANFPSNNWLSWGLYSLTTFLIYAISCFTLLIIGTRGMRSFVHRLLKNIIKR